MVYLVISWVLDWQWKTLAIQKPTIGHKIFINKALAHYIRYCKKSSYLQYIPQLFFTTATIFSTVFVYGQQLSQQFFRGIFAVLCVVWAFILKWKIYSNIAECLHCLFGACTSGENSCYVHEKINQIYVIFTWIWSEYWYRV